LETGEVVHFEDYFPPLNRWFEISAYPSEKGLSVFFKDISQRKRSEEQIRLSNERFEKVAEATNDAIWDWDVKKDKLYWGPGYLTLFGHNYQKENLVIKNWSELVHPDEYSAAIESVKSALNNPGQTKWEHHYRLKKADGSYAFVKDRGIIIRDQKRNALRMLGAITDITHQKQYENSLKKLNESLAKQAKELAMSNAELEQFAYVASHDLQEPLRMVTSFLTQLNKKYGDQLDEKAQKYIHFAVDGAKRMRQIILDLLEFSRIGKQLSEPDTIAISNVIHEVELLYRRPVLQKKAVIKTGKLPTIKSYYGPLLQIFQNLIGNSLKYSKKDVPPVIEIQCESLEKYWRFSISDNGIGIDPAYHEQIFVIFQRLHAQGEYQGTGMGLSIVKKIIEKLGGSIWLESSPGIGSTFYFCLPKNTPT